MSRNEPQHPNKLCGPSCRYRSLYEGTQSSLADLAGKQAHTLNRLGRLRQGLVLLLRASTPRAFGELEDHLGMRISEVDDEALLSCAQWLLEQGDDGAGLGELRDAMAAAGYRVAPTDGPVSLAASIRAGVAYHFPSSAGGFSQHGSSRRVRRTLAEAAALHQSSTAAPAGQSDPPRPAAPAAPSTHAAPPGPEAGAVQAPARSDDFTATAIAALDNLFDDDNPLMESADATAWAETPSEVPDPTAALDAVHAPQAPTAQPAAPSPPVVAATAIPPVTQPTLTAPAPRQVRGAPVKPELFPSAGRATTLPASRRRRRSRVSATAPTSMDVPGAAMTPPAAPDDNLDARLLAATTIPRPVFVSDLAALAGSGDAVEAWIERCRSDKDSGLRFIPPKQRHRLRGSLVLPVGELREAATEFGESWWAECLSTFRGAKLYELAVLLHAVGDRLVSWRVAEDHSTVLMRLNEPRGVVGVVVVLSDQLAAGESARAQLAADMSELLRDRLELLVVLVTAEPLLDPVITAVSEEAASAKWKPACHVVAARSWEWAAGDAGASRHVLG